MIHITFFFCGGKIHCATVLTLRKIASVFVALIALGMPVIACALPGMEMNEDENACCRQMAEKCGMSQMPDSHSCCKGSPELKADSVQVKHRFAGTMTPGLQVAAARAFIPVLNRQAMDVSGLISSESPPGCSPILRI